MYYIKNIVYFKYVYFNIYKFDIFTNLEYIVKMDIYDGFYEYVWKDDTMDKELRKVPTKNYIILGVVIVITMLLLYYFCMWVDVYKESKINIPIMDKYMSVINYNELDNYIVENPNTMVYVSILEDENIREFEKKLKSKYKSNVIDNDILYMNITMELKDSNLSKEIKNKYSLGSFNGDNVPYVLVFNNGVLNSVYNIKDNDYDIDKFIVYVNNIELESDEI